MPRAGKVPIKFQVPNTFTVTINVPICEFSVSQFKGFVRTVFTGHLLWNELPLEIREIRCQTTFKFRVKQHLWTLAFSEFSNTELDISLSDGIT